MPERDTKIILQQMWIDRQAYNCFVPVRCVKQPESFPHINPANHTLVFKCLSVSQTKNRKEKEKKIGFFRWLLHNQPRYTEFSSEDQNQDRAVCFDHDHRTGHSHHWQQHQLYNELIEKKIKIQTKKIHFYFINYYFNFFFGFRDISTDSNFPNFKTQPKFL